MYINYDKALYRLDNKGNVCLWIATKGVGDKQVDVIHGMFDGKKTVETFNTHRNVEDEIVSRTNAKRKSGYKFLSEVKDNIPSPVEEDAIHLYLKLYLTKDRTAADGTTLPMLAKAYDNKDNRLFNKGQVYLGQPKINGLRCNITAYRNDQDMFKPVGLRFQSREGNVWTSLSGFNSLEEYLLDAFGLNILNRMIDENIVLDGEIYLPGATINDINHYVKDSKDPKNKQLQFWLYDLNIADSAYKYRKDLIKIIFVNSIRTNILGKEYHLNNTRRFIVLEDFPIHNHDMAVVCRNRYISYGFEGLMLRLPDEEYQAGKRNLALIKFKKHLDGIFTVVDIFSEGGKRPDIPLLRLRNDLNSNTFDVHLSGTFEYQKSVLLNKDKYIGQQVEAEYGERSGVTNVPFHVKTVRFV